MISMYYKSVREKTLTLIRPFKPGSWVHVTAPTGKELETLRDDHNLDEGLLTDAVDFYEVPRLEVRDDVTYIFTRVPFRDEETRSRTTPLLLAIGPNFLLTLTREPLPFFDAFIKESSKINTTQKTKLFLSIFSKINATYQSFLTDINRSVRRDTIQLEQSQSISNKDIIEFLTFEKSLNDFLAALQPTSVILEKLLSGKVLKLYDDDKELVEDFLLATNQLVELSRSNLKNIVNLRQAYSIIVTSNLNRVIKMLTSLTVLITVPTMIASFYGMNVPLPFDDSPYVFLGMIGFSVAISIILLILFIKKRWL